MKNQDVPMKIGIWDDVLSSNPIIPSQNPF